MKAQTLFHFPPFTFNLLARELTRDGQPLALSPKACALLIHLLQRPNQVLLHAELIQALWPRGHVSRTILPHLIGELRRSLGDSAHQPRWIKTVNRTGYRFVGELVDVPLSPRASDTQPMPLSVRAGVRAGQPSAPQDLGRAQALGVQMALQMRHKALYRLLLQLRQSPSTEVLWRRRMALSDLLEAMACIERERTTAALALLSRAHGWWPHPDDNLIQALAQTIHGLVALLEARPNEAARMLLAAWHRAEQLEMFLLKHECAWGLNRAHAMLAEWGPATEWLEQSIRLTRQSDSVWLMERQRRRLGTGALEVARRSVAQLHSAPGHTAHQ